MKQNLYTYSQSGVLFLLLSRSVKAEVLVSACCLQDHREFGITLPVIFIRVPQIADATLHQKRGTHAVSAKSCLSLFKNTLYNLITT